jgi:Na+-transporting methylmalonyl-CoA/oxaloacetate decarboxylase gamma subunit
MNEMYLGVQLMGIGLAGVFTVLIVFYAVIRLLVKFFPDKPEEKSGSL